MTIFGGILIIVIGVSIVLSIVLSKDRNASDKNVGNDIAALPPLPEDLDVICEHKNVLKREWYIKCETACKPAVCCTNKDSAICAEDMNEDICIKYMICNNLYIASLTEEASGDALLTSSETVLSKVAPTSLTHYCSAEYIEKEGRIVCDDICELGECCWESEEKSCYAMNKVICNGYSACRTRDNITITHVDENNDEKPKNETIDAVESPTDDDDAVDLLVEETCALEKLDSLSGKQECEDLCSSRSCCFTEESDNCYISHNSWCSEFSPCLNMARSTVSDGSNNTVQEQSGSNSDQENGRLAVVSACAPGNLLTTEGIEICINICKPRECCFLESYNCYNDELREWCDEYDVCKAVITVADVVGPVDDGSAFSVDVGADTAKKKTEIADIFEVDLACAPKKLQTTEGQSKCKEICDTRACCFRHGDEYCGTRMPAECNRYVACNNLFTVYEDAEETLANENDNGGEPNEVNYEQNESMDVDMFLLKTIDEACTSENLVSTKGRIECKQICDGRSCCFPEAYPGTSDCFSQFPGWCAQYDACRALGADYQSGGSTFSEELTAGLNERCSVEKLRDFNVWMACNYLCEERSCCKFDACPQKKEWCDGYEICQIQEISIFDHNLDDNSVETENNSSTEYSITPEEVNAICSREKFVLISGLQECKDVCKEKMCCFEKGTRNCSRDSKRQCFDFFACKEVIETSVVGSSAGSYGAIPPPNLTDICAPQKIKHEIGYNKCADKCMQAECCRNSDEESCDQNMCTAFTACNSIWDSVFDGFEPNAGSSEGKAVAELCSIQSVQTLRGRVECQEACTLGSCCWAEGSGSCAESQRQMCLKYTTCPRD